MLYVVTGPNKVNGFASIGISKKLHTSKFVCFTIMYLLWVVATYYAQVQAFQWRVAALFWSCFGGVEMLRDFGLAENF
ncbi:unnamed protein product, partial [Symbiodinium sp. CCMP2456]